MKIRHRSAAWTALAAIAFSACGDDAITDPNVDVLRNLEGIWDATSVVFTPADAPGTPAFDLVALGGSLRLDVDSGGEVVLTTNEPGGTDPDVETGTINILSAMRLELRLVGETPLALDFVLTGGSLTLAGRSAIDVEAYSGPADLMASLVRR